MGLTVITPAQAQTGTAVGDLVDLASVKAELGILSTGDDAVIQELIANASAAISQYCNRTFQQQVYDETLAAYGGCYLTLHETPIIGVTSVLFQGQPITDFSIEDPQAGMLYRQNLWTWTTQMGWNLTGFPLPRSEAVDAAGAFEVRYTAGWITPKQTSPPIALNAGGLPLPSDIVKGARDLTKWYYQRRKMDPELVVRQTESLRLQWAQRDETLPPDLPRPIAWLLRPYVKIDT